MNKCQHNWHTLSSYKFKCLQTHIDKPKRTSYVDTFMLEWAHTRGVRKRLFSAAAFWTRLKKSLVLARIVRDKGNKTWRWKRRSTGQGERAPEWPLSHSKAESSTPVRPGLQRRRVKVKFCSISSLLLSLCLLSSHWALLTGGSACPLASLERRSGVCVWSLFKISCYCHWFYYSRQCFISYKMLILKPRSLGERET